MAQISQTFQRLPPKAGRERQKARDQVRDLPVSFKGWKGAGQIRSASRRPWCFSGSSKTQQLLHSSEWSSRPVLPGISPVPLSQVFRPRRHHHQCHQQRKLHTIKFVTHNTEKLSWTRTDKRCRLLSIVEGMRKHSVDMLCLQDVVTPSWLRKGGAEEGDHVIHLVKLEEYTMIIFGCVGLLLAPWMLRAWRESGCHVSTAPNSDRWLCVHITFNKNTFHFISTYVPPHSDKSAGAIGSAIEAGRFRREQHFEAGTVLLEKCVRKHDIVLIGGDFNSHFGKADEGCGWTGPHVLRQPPSSKLSWQTATWADHHSLSHVQSYLPYKERGTWHCQPKGPSRACDMWMELDYVLTNVDPSSIPHRFQGGRPLECWNSDHRAAWVKFAVPGNRMGHWRRKAKELDMSDAPGQPGKIRWEECRGSTETAKEKQEDFARISDTNFLVAEISAEQPERWTALAATLREAAEEVCGRKKKGMRLPCLTDMRPKLAEQREEKQKALRALWHAKGTDQEEACRHRLRETSKNLRQKERAARTELLNETCKEIEWAVENGEQRLVWSNLRKLGLHLREHTMHKTSGITPEAAKEHLLAVSGEPNQTKAKWITDEFSLPINVDLEKLPEQPEYEAAIKAMKISAAGQDEVNPTPP